MTGLGHLRKWEAALGMSAPGGETDVIEQKADIHAGHRIFGIPVAKISK
jgi:hypothetical protein